MQINFVVSNRYGASREWHSPHRINANVNRAQCKEVIEKAVDNFTMNTRAIALNHRTTFFVEEENGCYHIIKMFNRIELCVDVRCIIMGICEQTVTDTMRIRLSANYRLISISGVCMLGKVWDHLHVEAGMYSVGGFGLLRLFRVLILSDILHISAFNNDNNMVIKILLEAA